MACQRGVIKEKFPYWLRQGAAGFEVCRALTARNRLLVRLPESY